MAWGIAGICHQHCRTGGTKAVPGKRVQRREVLGPLNPFTVPQVYTSPFGVRPKGSKGKWRLPVDMSSPEGASINDEIRDGAQGLHECSRREERLPQRSHPPEDRWAMGMMWEKESCIDTALPIGLCAAPQICTAIAMQLSG